VTRAWGALRRSWGAGAARLPGGGELRLTLRGVSEGVVLVVEGGEGWSTPQGEPVPDALALLEAVPELRAVWHRRAEREPRCVAGDPDASESWAGARVPVRAGAFLQVNRAAAEALRTSVLAEVAAPAGSDLTGLLVVDAYAGVAVYGRELARRGARVVALELSPDAVAAARADAPPGLEVVQGRVEDALEAALPAGRLILNPPRAGLDPEVPRILREHPVPRTVYVSCDPATLARDLGRLGTAFHVQRVAAFDLFPQTAHVETVVTLVHQEVP
jgi:23S rRNA (uracil1939-C5)-methyltransferase